MDSNFVNTIRDIIKNQVGLDKNGYTKGMDSTDMKNVMAELVKLTFTDKDSMFMLDLLTHLLTKYSEVEYWETYR